MKNLLMLSVCLMILVQGVAFAGEQSWRVVDYKGKKVAELTAKKVKLQIRKLDDGKLYLLYYPEAMKTQEVVGLKIDGGDLTSFPGTHYKEYNPHISYLKVKKGNYFAIPLSAEHIARIERGSQLEITEMDPSMGDVPPYVIYEYPGFTCRLTGSRKAIAAVINKKPPVAVASTSKAGKSFCPKGGAKFSGSERFCPTHGVKLKPVRQKSSGPTLKETVARLEETFNNPANKGEFTDTAGSFYLHHQNIDIDVDRCELRIKTKFDIKGTELFWKGDGSAASARGYEKKNQRRNWTIPLNAKINMYADGNAARIYSSYYEYTYEDPHDGALFLSQTDKDRQKKVRQSLERLYDLTREACPGSAEQLAKEAQEAKEKKESARKKTGS